MAKDTVVVVELWLGGRGTIAPKRPDEDGDWEVVGSSLAVSPNGGLYIATTWVKS